MERDSKDIKELALEAGIMFAILLASLVSCWAIGNYYAGR